MLEIVFTMPEQVVLMQEDDPDQNRLPKNEDDDDDDDEENKQPKMFFIAKGKFGVSIKKNHGVSVIKYTSDKKKEKPDRILQDGDHFGEISLIYNCKRTATVESCNYGTLASLKKENFLELQNSTFENIIEVFKKQICLYDDEVKMFLAFAMEKISYFKYLKLLTKQEIFHSMERVTYEKDALLCKKGDIATKMFVIQDGIVEVACKYAPRIDEEFVIERLGRGSIINHRSFMLEDDADTDFRCLTSVSCFELSADKIKEIKNKREDMRTAYRAVEEEVLIPQFPLALDYIIHNNRPGKKEYLAQLKKNQMRVKLKNAIMQSWQIVKSDKKPPSMNELIEEMLKAKKAGHMINVFEANAEALEKSNEEKEAIK